jgi:hypothetical protein
MQKGPVSEIIDVERRSKIFHNTVVDGLDSKMVIPNAANIHCVLFSESISPTLGRMIHRKKTNVRDCKFATEARRVVRRNTAIRA